MADRHKDLKSNKAGGNVIPALCNILGTVLLVAVIASGLAMTLPRMMGFGMYNIVSPSMEPKIPVGSLIYVKNVDPAEVEEGDVIAFIDRNSSVVAHRVVQNSQVEGEFVTKGDANETEDPEPVQYENLDGRVVLHIPMLGGLMAVYASTPGKVYLAAAAVCGVMLNMLGGRMRESRRQEDT